MGLLTGLRVLWQKLLDRLGLSRILCDACRYDYGTACTRPERPNATVCPDYRSRS